MASDNQANYAKIGFFILTGIVLILVTLVWLGGAGTRRHEFSAETYFTNPVSGLDIGSAVNFRGVRVGSVRRISFIGAEYKVRNPDDKQKIYVQMAFDTRLFQLGDNRTAEELLHRLVERGLHATVSSSGVTGLSRIELNFPKTAVPEESVSWRPRYVSIPPAPSILQSAGDSVQRILAQVNRMDLIRAWSNVVETTESVHGLLDTLNTMVESQRGNVAEILDNTREMTSSLRDFAADVKANPGTLLRNTEPARLDETR